MASLAIVKMLSAEWFHAGGDWGGLRDVMMWADE
jgi:hypothetical protein